MSNEYEAFKGVMEARAEIEKLHAHIQQLEALKVLADKAVNALYDTQEAMWLHAKNYLKAAKELDGGQ